MTIIDLVLAPDQIIIIGPRATLGRLLIIVKKGSVILAKIGISYNKIAKIKPREIPIRKARTVSYKVVKICFHNSPVVVSCHNVSMIRPGLEKIKASIILWHARYSQIPKKQTTINAKRIFNI